MMEQADRLSQAGQTMEAIQTLELFWVNYPKSPLLPEALLKLGDILVNNGDLKKAVEAYQSFLKQFPSESRIPDAYYALSRAYLQMGNVEEALDLWNKISGQEKNKHSIYNRAAEIYTEREEYYAALRVLIQKNRALSNILPEEAEADKDAMMAIIHHRLSEADLERVVSEWSPHFPADEAEIRLIRRYHEKGVYYRAEKAIKHFLSQFMDHPYTDEVEQVRQTIRDAIRKNRYRIAALLPLSGTLASFGESALGGIQLALQDFKEALPGISVALVVKDSHESSERGESTLESWLTDYKPIGMVGPLQSQEVNKVAPLAEKGGWAIITPGASAEMLASQGKAVFRNTVTPLSQCRDLAEYAVKTLKVKRMALLVQEGEWGKKWVSCMTDGLNPWGGKVAVVKSYSSKTVDFKAQIVHLRNVLRKPADGSSQGFDALFLPGKAERVGLIIPQLAFYNLQGVRLLGTMEWNSPEFLKLVGPHAEGAIFMDGFFIGSSDPLAQHFIQKYQEQFQHDPDLFAAQAYDATWLILEAIRRGASTPSAVRQAVSEITDFQGVSGYIYEMQNGAARKKPFILEIQKGRFVQINS